MSVSHVLALLCVHALLLTVSNFWKITVLPATVVGRWLVCLLIVMVYTRVVSTLLKKRLSLVLLWSAFIIIIVMNIGMLFAGVASRALLSENVNFDQQKEEI